MYKAKYYLKTKENSEGDEEIDTVFQAKFRFRKDVAPQDRKGVRERIKNISHFFGEESLSFIRHLPGKDRKMFFWNSPSPKRLYYKLDISSNDEVSLEEMPDRKAIKNYILGKE